MPKRTLPTDCQASTDAIVGALARGHEMDASQEQKFEHFRRNAQIRKTAVFLKLRGDRPVYRRHEGCHGADLVDHPLILSVKRAERDYLTIIAKLDRRPPTVLAVRARRDVAEALASRVLALLKANTHFGSGAAGVVARILQVTPQYVRQIRKKRN